ncbi:MAG: hypothetical protein JWO36_7327 [Myxococcales bacterium]|nr:hypothetical protein [Myxococcales bacterium]
MHTVATSDLEVIETTIAVNQGTVHTVATSDLEVIETTIAAPAQRASAAFSNRTILFWSRLVT